MSNIAPIPDDPETAEPSAPWPGATTRSMVPNALSVARLCATPVVVVLLLVAPRQRLAAVILFAAASVTDYVDGYLARRWRVVSRFGTLCDLMADKLLVASVLIALVSIRLVPVWCAIVIVGRELVVSGLRAWAAERDVSIPASVWGKGKTLLTLIAIFIAIVNWSPTLSLVLILAATALTLLSAVDYVVQAWRAAHA